MTTEDDEFLQTLRATFRLEAAEHVQTIASGLGDLEKSPPAEAQQRLVNQVFRAVHSLKGAARAADFVDIETLCASLEDTFAAWRTLASAPADSEINRAYTALDSITGALAASHEGSSLGAAAGPAPAPRALSVAGRADRQPAGEDTVRMATSKLDAQFLGAEEMLGVKLMTARRVGDLRNVERHLVTWGHEWASLEPHLRSIRPAVGRIDNPSLVADVNRLLDFLDWTLNHCEALQADLASLYKTADQDALTVAKLVDDLLESSKKLLLLPFATVAVQIPKMVRDLSRDQGKQVELSVTGEDIEMDKRILEELKDPIIHLLRNSMDHGIEAPDERVRRGKPAHGRITIAASQVDGSHIELVVADDGAGIDLAKVKDAAIRHGVLAASDAAGLGDREALQLVFQPDFSTSTTVTRISGRGLGLAIVREKTERLGGSVAVDSRPGESTRFTLRLPAMLATFRGILVSSARCEFVVPTAQVERVERVSADAIGTVEGRRTVSLAGRAVAVVRLAEVLQLPRGDLGSSGSGVTLLVLGSGDQRMAFEVDAVLDEQEVILKPLRKPLSRVRNIAGATILASGQVAPVLNVPDLLASARRVTPVTATADAGPAPPPMAKAVLVAEDSITSRILIKSILEAAGFQVTTAADGIEAFTLLRAGRFDLLVSDVEMPRLNGFDLTARVRADRRLAELPVILVTALETAEDKTRGIDAGADAYIVKSRFDQHELLDAARRLV